jgi:hypothetical protein
MDTTHPKLGSNAVRMTTRDAGFEGEKNDCFVKAIQAVTRVPYRDAHAWVAREFKRTNRRPTHGVVDVMQRIEDTKTTVYGFRAFRKPASTGIAVRRTMFGYRQVATYRTLASFAASHRTGRWLLWSNNHAFGMVDGVIYDNGLAGPRTQVTGVYEFIESSKIEALDRQ